MSARRSDRWRCPKHGCSSRWGVRTIGCKCKAPEYALGNQMLEAERMKGNATRPGIKTAQTRKRMKK